MRTTIDLNCDLGEGCGHDLALMPWISSASIACGRHAGDANTMRDTARACLQHGVAIGAHPSFDDREGFGRREQRLDDASLRALVLGQLESLRDIVRTEGGRLAHVKPHGALYNLSARDADTARAIAETVAAFDPRLALFGLSGSLSIAAARSTGLVAVEEAFAERRYEADGSLSPRSLDDASIESIEDAVAQALSLLQTGSLRCRTGETLVVHADTLCLHGDRADVVGLAQALRTAFALRDVEVSSIRDAR